jgi:hypothetical protein
MKSRIVINPFLGARLFYPAICFSSPSGWPSSFTFTLSCLQCFPEASSCCCRCIVLPLRTCEGFFLLPMGRQKVDPRHRQRVAQACDNCKKRKEKCNGALPCEQCKIRRCDHGCRYTKQSTTCATRYSSRTTSTPPGHGTSEVQLSLLGTGNAAIQQAEKAVYHSGTISEDARMLKDCQGRFSMLRCWLDVKES